MYIELKEMNENVHIQDMMYTSRSKRTVPYVVPAYLTQRGINGKLKYGYESFFLKRVCEEKRTNFFSFMNSVQIFSFLSK